jgi:ATP-dependent Clp protease ATP-binding subunit ClpX
VVPHLAAGCPHGTLYPEGRNAAILTPGKKGARAERFDQEVAAFVRTIPLMLPREIESHVAACGYVGQEKAVRAISLGAYRHVSRLRRIWLEGARRESLPPKTTMLFVGPTGCGKTYLVEILFRDILRLPTVVVDMTGFSETGYVGQDVNSILTRLLYAADMSLAYAATGIVCLDEFDKLASGQNSAVFSGAGTTKDVSGLGVQRELLKMLESIEVPVPLEYTHSDYAPKAVMSTQDVGFVACGAFSGLKGMIDQQGEEHIGFGREPLSGEQDRIAVSYTEDDVMLARNFMSYGFLPELVGRFRRIVPFTALSREQLTRILSDTLLAQYVNEFRLEGKELSVADEVLARIVDESVRKETGARALEASLMRYLEEAAFQAFSEPSAKAVSLVVREGSIVHEIS